MDGNGGDKRKKRKRPVVLTARFTDEEAALIRDQAARAGVSVASLFRRAVLEQAPPRASRKPLANEELAAQLLAALMQRNTNMRLLAAKGTPHACDEEIRALSRDHGELRVAWFDAFGIEP